MSARVWKIGLPVGGAVLVALLWWLLAPVYSFFAHNGDLPFSPFGWSRLPDGPAPQVQTVHDPRYQAASDDALARMAVFRETLGAPSLSAAVAIDGELVWEGAVGWADIEAETPISTDRLYRIGSSSKAVTAIALARLVDRGAFDLDQPISEIFDHLPNPDWADITPRQLASHMSGVPHYDGNTELGGLYSMITLRAHIDDVREAVTLFDESELLFEPGSDFDYSSLGTVLLGAAMSEVTGLSYREIIRNEVLRPAGATVTRVAPREAGDPMVGFYYREGDRFRRWRPVDLSHRLPGGGWASTPAELVQIGSLMLDEDFISRDTREAFWTPQHLNSGEVNEQDYALGWRWREWEIEGVGPMRNANHGGVSRGSQCWLMILPDYNMVIAFTINQKTDPFWDFGALYEDIARAFVPVVMGAE